MALHGNTDPPYKNEDETHRFCEEEEEDLDSTCSTPYVSAPSSPGRTTSLINGVGVGGYFFSAPASPMHYVTCSYHHLNSVLDSTVSGAFDEEFEFSSRFSPDNNDGMNATGLSMSSADELFLNGQIRPVKLSSHLQRPQVLTPLSDLDDDDDDDEDGDTNVQHHQRGRDVKFRCRSSHHRKARSLSPLRNDAIRWHEGDDEDGDDKNFKASQVQVVDKCLLESESESLTETTPSVSASSSRSSSSGRNSKKWIFLKDLLYRSKSEGRSRVNEKHKEKFWSNISFNQIIKERKLNNMSQSSSCTTTKEGSSNEVANETHKRKKGGKQEIVGKKTVGAAGKPANGVAAKRRGKLSAHELHYTKNRAQAEEMKKRTFLPYRQGLLGCLGFSSKGYGALNGLTKSFNPGSSR